MSKLKVDGIWSDYSLRLSTQCSATDYDVRQWVHKLANVWKPKQAVSYNIMNFRHTNYNGEPVPEGVITGYSTFDVEYFTTKKEGKYEVVKEKK